jgi:hypothetical protein
VTTINIKKAQVDEMHFIFNLECRHAALLRGIPHRLSIKFQCSTNPKNPSEVSEIQWSHTFNILLNHRKLDGPVS